MRLKDHKSSGENEIQREIPKHENNYMIENIFTLIKEIWNEKSYQKMNSSIYPKHKKSDKQVYVIITEA